MTANRLSRWALAGIFAFVPASLGVVALASPAAAADCEGRYFEVDARQAEHRWSVYGDLYNSKGEKVRHWQDTSNKPGGSLRWNFTYCGDGGWAHIWIHHSDGLQEAYLNVNLTHNRCWEISKPEPGANNKSIVYGVVCPG